MVADMALLGFLSLRFTYVKIEDTLEGGSFENSEASGNNNVNNIPLEEKKQSKDDWFIIHWLLSKLFYVNKSCGDLSLDSLL